MNRHLQEAGRPLRLSVLGVRLGHRFNTEVRGGSGNDGSFKRWLEGRCTFYLFHEGQHLHAALQATPGSCSQWRERSAATTWRWSQGRWSCEKQPRN